MEARHTPEDTLSVFAQCLGVTMDDLLSHCRKVELVDARSMIVAVLIEHAHLRQQDVAPLFDFSQAGVSKLLTRHHLMMKNPGGNLDYQKRFADLALTPCPLSLRRGGAQSDEKALRPAGTPLHDGEGSGVRSNNSDDPDQ